MTFSNPALMMLKAQRQLPPGVVFQDPTPSVYILGIRQIPAKFRDTPPPIAYYNDNGRMKVWGWEPEQEYWRPIGIHHPSP